MKPPSALRPRHAFTLVELLVVIAIIVILMSLLLTAVPAVKRAAQKTEARNSANQVVAALKSYYNEYGRFPPTDDPSKTSTGAVTTDIVVGDTKSGVATTANNAVFYALRNIPKGPNQDYIANPRKLTFYEGKVATVNASGIARGGFYDRSANGSSPPATEDSCLYDPWGHQFFVIIDANSDGRIDLEGYYNDFAGVSADGRAPRNQVGVFSLGPDEKLGNKGDRTYRNGTELSDDVVSWE